MQRGASSLTNGKRDFSNEESWPSKEEEEEEREEKRQNMEEKGELKIKTRRLRYRGGVLLQRSRSGGPGHLCVYEGFGYPTQQYALLLVSGYLTPVGDYYS